MRPPDPSRVIFKLDGVALILYAIRMTRDEQIADLIRMESRKMMRFARLGVLVVAAGLVMGGALTGHPVFYGIALFFSLLALAIWRTTPHIENAARGLKEGRKQNGDVDISILRWTDAEFNQYESYRGLVSMDKLPLWLMDFVTPEIWQPAEGKYEAQLVFISGVEWPVVVITSTGLLYPRLTPRRAAGSERGFIS